MIETQEQGPAGRGGQDLAHSLSLLNDVVPPLVAQNAMPTWNRQRMDFATTRGELHVFDLAHVPTPDGSENRFVHYTLGSTLIDGSPNSIVGYRAGEVVTFQLFIDRLAVELTGDVEAMQSVSALSLLDAFTSWHHHVAMQQLPCESLFRQLMESSSNGTAFDQTHPDSTRSITENYWLDVNTNWEGAPR